MYYKGRGKDLLSVTLEIPAPLLCSSGIDERETCPNSGQPCPPQCVGSPRSLTPARTTIHRSDKATMSDAETAADTTNQDNQNKDEGIVRVRISMPKYVLDVLDKLAADSFGGNRSKAVRAAVLGRVGKWKDVRILDILEELKADIEEIKELLAGIDNTSNSGLNQPAAGIDDSMEPKSESVDFTAEDLSNAKVTREIFRFLIEHGDSDIQVQTLFRELSDFSKADIMAGVENLEARGLLTAASDNQLRYLVESETDSGGAANSPERRSDAEQT